MNFNHKTLILLYRCSPDSGKLQSDLVKFGVSYRLMNLIRMKYESGFIKIDLKP
jgi:hypothetical protein